MKTTACPSTKYIKKFFQIGNFYFQVNYPEMIMPPTNFLLFETQEKSSDCYTYQIDFRKNFSPDDLSGFATNQSATVRETLLLYRSGDLEARLLKPPGTNDCYALYKELSKTEALILLYESFRPISAFDAAFCSIFALEKRLLFKNGLILHCACLQYKESAILFSAPSGVGKSTQASLWETYKNAHTINGDRILLQYKKQRWHAHGWPVCGSSGICENRCLPVRAIVTLSQKKENTLSRIENMEAFSAIYSQITVNSWNPSSVRHVMDLTESLLHEIPVYHLGCTISKEAVELLAKALEE